MDRDMREVMLRRFLLDYQKRACREEGISYREWSLPKVLRSHRDKGENDERGSRD